MKKLTLPQIDDRLIYLAAVAVAPSIPLFYLYNRNNPEGLLFKHFLVTGGVLAVISLAIYLPVSKFILRCGHAMIIIALFWAAFWFFKPIGNIIARDNASAAFYLLLSIGLIGYFLDGIEINRLVKNTMAILLCLMFAYNFVPGVFIVSRSEIRRAYNKWAGKLPYEIKTEFNIVSDLHKPNIYWLHMDAMMGFDAVEHYFNDPQTALKNDLLERGFIINKSARLEAGYTRIAMAAMLSPVFYDSYLAGEFARAAKFAGFYYGNSIITSMTKKGFSLDDIYPQIELLKAFSDAGYLNIGNSAMVFTNVSINVDMMVDDAVTTYTVISREALVTFNKFVNFKNIITDASVLSVIKPKIDEMFEKEKPISNDQPLPAYQETVNRYLSGSDVDWNMDRYVRDMKYTASIQTPHFYYISNLTAHVGLFGTVIGKVTYKKPVGHTFFLDEYGRYYKERQDDPLDVHLYLPQHKYAVKEMMAQIDTVIENDPDAVIIIQGDHGIHAHGIDYSPSGFKSMSARGYNTEEQKKLHFSVISAVRIPPQYGKLSQPLDPLDIGRYLVNNFVGKGNYDYLYYKEE